MRFITFAALIFMLSLLCSCANYGSTTTVLGIEVAYNPTQSVIPTARAGLIQHKQLSVEENAHGKITSKYNSIDLWRASGSAESEIKINE